MSSESTERDGDDERKNTELAWRQRETDIDIVVEEILTRRLRHQLLKY